MYPFAPNMNIMIRLNMYKMHYCLSFSFSVYKPILGPTSDSKDFQIYGYFNQLLEIGNGGQVTILHDRPQHLNNCLTTQYIIFAKTKWRQNELRVPHYSQTCHDCLLSFMNTVSVNYQAK